MAPFFFRASKRRRWFVGIALATAVVVGSTYVPYLTYPGPESVTERTVEYLRDHGGDGAVDAIEQWWYTRNPPGAGTPDGSSLPDPGAVVEAIAPSVRGSRATPPPAGLDPIVTSDRMRGEGRWVPVGQSIDGVPTMYTTFLRPNRDRTSVAASVVSLDQRLLRVVSVPGYAEPVRRRWAWASEVPGDLRGALAATFNSGFRYRHIRGGLYVENREVVPLVAGEATLVVHRDGTASVDEWGRDATLDGDVVAARQNLRLIVDDGRAIADLMTRHDGSWGRPRHQLQITWRSGVGVDAAGRLLYASGDDMDLQDLADVLVQAGAVRAMQLDIHDDHVAFSVFQPTDSGGTRAVHLVDSMGMPPDRYLSPSRRDFFAVLVR